MRGYQRAMPLKLACMRRCPVISAYGGCHTARRSCCAADSSWRMGVRKDITKSKGYSIMKYIKYRETKEHGTFKSIKSDVKENIL